MSHPENTLILKRKIPRDQTEIPCVGLGTYRTFDHPSLPAHTEPLMRALDAFYSHGGRLIDTSPMYGKSEEMVGELTERSGFNDRCLFATKVWTTGREDGIRQIHRSLKLLKRERIDLLQIHNLVDWKIHLETLNRLKEQGVIRYTGITHYTPTAFSEMERIMLSDRIDFIQIPYSVNLRHAEKRILPLAADREIAVLINMPFGGHPPEITGRAIPTKFIDRGVQSETELRLKFILAHPAVTCVIPGSGNAEHIRRNLRAGTGWIPNEVERTEILNFFK